MGGTEQRVIVTVYEDGEGWCNYPLLAREEKKDVVGASV